MKPPRIENAAAALPDQAQTATSALDAPLASEGLLQHSDKSAGGEDALDFSVAGARSFKGGPFDLNDLAAWRHWRAEKLKRSSNRLEDLLVQVRDAAHLSRAEARAIALRCCCSGMALYQSAVVREDPGVVRALGLQLGLNRIDANWLADADGVSPIRVRDSSGEMPAGEFIPYTNRALQWHTDGYYQSSQRSIRSMILHCVRPAASGGINCLLDHELVYLRLREDNPDHIAALMAEDAMQIPARMNQDSVARAAQSGPVFSIGPNGGLHMRYTSRTRSIVWKDDESTRRAVQALQTIITALSSSALAVRLEAGMGLVANNVLHTRAAFVDDEAAPRLILRGRFLDAFETLASRY